MKKIIAVLFSLTFIPLIFAQSNVIAQEAYASYYGDEFNGRQTANGEIYDMNNFTAAHRTLPFGSIVQVTNLDNNMIVYVRINDRGPFVANREIDLSKAAANALDMLQQGIARVSITLISSPTANTQAVPVAGTTSNQAESQPITTTLPQSTGTVYTPAQKQNGLVLWRIQLGSFAREENALRMVESLRKIGFEPAYEKADTTVRVVLYGIKDTDLEKVKTVLKINDYSDYIIRQESW